MSVPMMHAPLMRRRECRPALVGQRVRDGERFDVVDVEAEVVSMMAGPAPRRGRGRREHVASIGAGRVHGEQRARYELENRNCSAAPPRVFRGL